MCLIELPTYLQIEPAGQCNLRCQMCSIQFRRDGPPHGPSALMPFSAFTRIIDQFTSLRELHLQGLGEPMMNPSFFDMVSYAAQRGVTVTTNSNLTLLRQKDGEWCATSGLDCLCISVDGATAAMYESIRVGARFERLIRNLEWLLEARRRLGSKTPHLQMVIVVMRQNLHELPDLVQLANRFSMERVFVQHLCHDFGESSLPAQYRPMREFVQAQTLLAEDAQQVEHYFDRARYLAGQLGIELRLPHILSHPHQPGNRGSRQCDWPWTGAYISYDGYAMPCCMVSTPDRINFGNMAERGVEEIWNGEAYNGFRNQLASDNPPDICRSCSLYQGTF